MISTEVIVPQIITISQ